MAVAPTATLTLVNVPANCSTARSPALVAELTPSRANSPGGMPHQADERVQQAPDRYKQPVLTTVDDL